jgi:hypothetical protein
MIDVTTMDILSDTDNHISYQMPNGCVLYVVKSVNYPEYPDNLGITVVDAHQLGKTLIRDEYSAFTVQTVDCVTDEPDSGMVILLVQ